MAGRSKTRYEHYELVSLAVDNEPVLFMTATVTKETSLVEAVTPFERGATSWHGQIVWDILTPGLIDTERPRKFKGNTARGETLEGHFVITQSHIRGVDFDGSGELTVS
jgi:hypothetical protein